MSDLPQVYRHYDLLFTPRLISKLRNLRGEQWAELIDQLATLPETHPDALAFSMMMIKLGNCLSCDMDSYRAQRGCSVCSQHTVASFKGSDNQLFRRYQTAKKVVAQHLNEPALPKAA
ncbi:MAG TPA: hypothetical protein PKE64_03190 [Anaerolineae bacterium]|nr:hypothetical protein [Anaerolineae bacterium]